MSRWRETLCGSLIKSNGEAAQAVLKGEASGVLTCGGTFIPQNNDRPLFARRFMLHLPKQSQEMIVIDSGNNLERYKNDGIDINQEFEELENAIRHMEAKPIK